MRYHYYKTIARNFFKEFHYLNARLAVERARRFVRKQNFGVVYKRAGDSHPLHLPARKLIGANVDFVFKPHFFKNGNRAFAAFFRAYPGKRQRQFDVFENGLVRNKIVTLKNKPDGVITVCIPLFIAELFSAFSVDYKIARSIAVKSADNV